MVKTERFGNTAKMTIYSEVGSPEFNGGSFAKMLSEAEAYASKIDIHLHSYGGSVFDGNVIASAIENSKADICIYIDGVAASMAAIICMSAKTLLIAKNGFLMLHCPLSGYMQENAKMLEEQAKMLRTIEDDFVKKVCKKSKRSETEVRTYFDGKDHWFTAQEAFSAGLVDGFQENVTETDMDGSSNAVAMSYGMVAMYHKFTALSGNSHSFSASHKQTSDSRTSWTLEDWQINDPKGLEKMIQRKDPLFKDLYLKAYGKTPKGFENVKSKNSISDIKAKGYTTRGREHWTMDDWNEFAPKEFEAIAKNKDPFFVALCKRTYPHLYK
jgi:ATP-dependent protease ClpP protease subunit